jgi:hypothetical protein
MGERTAKRVSAAVLDVESAVVPFSSHWSEAGWRPFASGVLRFSVATAGDIPVFSASFTPELH